MNRQWLHDLLALQRISWFAEKSGSATKAEVIRFQCERFSAQYGVPYSFAEQLAVNSPDEVEHFINLHIDEELDARMKNSKKTITGTLNFTSKELDVTDPCYHKGIWCRMTVPIEPGAYTYQVKFKDTGSWGIRVKEIRIFNKDVLVKNIRLGEVMPGEVGVDSGRAGFFENKPDYTDEEFDAIHDFIFADWHTKGIAKDFVEGHKDNVMKCECIETESGYGDGGYYVTELINKATNTRCGYRLRFI